MLFSLLSLVIFSVRLPPSTLNSCIGSSNYHLTIANSYYRRVIHCQSTFSTATWSTHLNTAAISKLQWNVFWYLLMNYMACYMPILCPLDSLERASSSHPDPSLLFWVIIKPFFTKKNLYSCIHIMVYYSFLAQILGFHRLPRARTFTRTPA